MTRCHFHARVLLSIALQAAIFVSPIAAQQTSQPAAVSPPAPSQPAAAAPNSAVPPAAAGRVKAADKSRAAKFYAQGAKAMESGNTRQAAKDFASAAALDTSNHDYQNAAEIARQHLLTQLVQESSKARLMGDDETARARLAEALKIDPSNLVVTQHITELADIVRAGRGDPSPTASTEYASIRLAPRTGPHDFHLRTSASEMLRQVFAAYGIIAIMDESIRPQTVRIDADGVDFDKASEIANLLARTFFVPLDPGRVLLAMDTKENRQKFERVSEETIYLPGMTATEMSDFGNVIRNIFDAQQSVVRPDAGTLTLRAPEATLQAVNATLAGLIEGRGQVFLEMRIYEIATTRSRNIGLQLPQQVTLFNVPTEVNSILNANQSLVNQIISSGLAKAGDYTAIAAILIASGAISGGILSQPFAVLGGGLTQEGITLGSVGVNFSLNTSESRSLDRVQLRAGDGEPATLRSGTRYPIVTSIYSTSSAASSIPGLNSPGLSSTLQSLGINVSNASSAQVIPQVQYEDLGLTLKATPRIQRSRDITLALDLKVEALGGGAINGNPILNSRQYSGTITVHDGATAVLVSNLDRSETKAVSGIPGLSEIPGFHSITDTSKEYDVSNLMIMITPHLVRSRTNQSSDPIIMFPRH